MNQIWLLRGTLNIKFGIYMRQTIILKGVLNNCSTHFLSPYYYLIIIIIIINHPILIIIQCFVYYISYFIIKLIIWIKSTLIF